MKLNNLLQNKIINRSLQGVVLLVAGVILTHDGLAKIKNR